MKLVFLLALAAFASIEGATVVSVPTDPPFVVSAYNDEVAYSDFLMNYLWALRYAQLRKYLEEQQRRQQQGPNTIDLGNRFGDKDEQPVTQGEVKPVTQSTVRPVVAQVTQAPCKQVGERCTYHWDCCSNACLFYLGKCVSG